MHKKSIFLVLLLSAALLAGCVSLRADGGRSSGLTIGEAKIELKGEEATQTLTYTLKMVNGTHSDIQVDWIKPEIGEVFSVMVGDTPLMVKMGIMIPSGASYTVKGSFPIRTNGIPKERLDEMGALITGFQMSSKQVLDIPGQPAQTHVPTYTARPKNALKDSKTTPTPEVTPAKAVKATKTKKP